MTWKQFSKWKENFVMRIAALFILAVFAMTFSALFTTQPVITCPGPDGEPESSDFTVKVGGKEVFLYQARVSAYPENQHWPGYQRPLEQTELASFCSFDADGTVEVEIESKKKNIDNVIIRPLSKNIRPVIDGNKISFALSSPCQLAIEVNDRHHALHLFANKVEDGPVDKSGDNVLYFGPGIHYPGVIELKDDQTLYVAAGAVVHTLVHAINVKNATIKGRGILDGSAFARDSLKNMETSTFVIHIVNSENITIDGVILRDPPRWCLRMFGSKNIDINNIKLIGNWRYNSDGINPINSSHVKVKNSFVRAFDDCVSLKGLQPKNDEQMNVYDVHFENCVFWNDWSRGVLVGGETMADSISRCSFHNCDIIHFVGTALCVMVSNRANIFDIEFEDIRIEDPITDRYFLGPPDSPKKLDPRPAYPRSIIGIQVRRGNIYVDEDELGKVYDIRFRNIQYTSQHPTRMYFEGYDSEHDISDVTIENVTINGKKVLGFSDADIRKNNHVNNVTFK